MKREVGVRWRLREVMAAHGYWKTTDMVPLLAERGVELSASQVFRLVTSPLSGCHCAPWSLRRSCGRRLTPDT